MEGTKNNFTDRLENRKTHLSSSPILFRTINRLHYAFKPVKKLSILPVVQVPHKTISAVQQNHPATHPLHFTEKTMVGFVCKPFCRTLSQYRFGAAFKTVIRVVYFGPCAVPHSIFPLRELTRINRV